MPGRLEYKSRGPVGERSHVVITGKIADDKWMTRAYLMYLTCETLSP